MWDRIVNPESGRKVSVYGKIGQKVLKNYVKQIGGTKLRGGPDCTDTELVNNNNRWYGKCDNPYGNKDGICNINDLNLNPGNDRKKWTVCSNPPDGHCFYWTLLRFLRAYNFEDLRSIFY